VGAKDLILDFSEYDLNHVIADVDEIRRLNQQRFEMEQLTAVCFEDFDRKIAVGYKDHGHDAFWARGHMPGMPLLPGVLICEAAAQLCSYQSRKYKLLGDTVLGFGGMDEVRFRNVVLPGSRLVIVAQLTKLRPNALVVCRFQAFVNQSIVGEGQIIGVPLPVERLKEASV
jgi:3-hydroxyacyl-[acyl-carrier-protein] dehydratase